MYCISKNTENTVTQRDGESCIPGNIPGQVEQGSEQPDVVQDVPAHCRRVELDLPIQVILIL